MFRRGDTPHFALLLLSITSVKSFSMYFYCINRLHGEGEINQFPFPVTGEIMQLQKKGGEKKRDAFRIS